MLKRGGEYNTGGSLVFGIFMLHSSHFIFCSHTKYSFLPLIYFLYWGTGEKHKCNEEVEGNTACQASIVLRTQQFRLTISLFAVHWVHLPFLGSLKSLFWKQREFITF